MTETSIDLQPANMPTDASFNVLKAKLFKVFNKLWKQYGQHLTNYSFVAEIDAEITMLINEAPWFLKPTYQQLTANYPQNLGFIPWQQHVLHTCICMQRIRMYRPFLHPRVGRAWEMSLNAVADVLSLYRHIRIDERQPQGTLSRKAHFQGYQLYSVGVHLGIFLLVERPALGSTTATQIRNDIELIISDLSAITDTAGALPEGIPVDIDGQKVLRRILDLYDEQAQDVCSPPISADATLVPSVSSVLGGERVARTYLEQSAIPYILDREPRPSTPRAGRRAQAAGASNGGAGYSAPYVPLLDPSHPSNGGNWDEPAQQSGAGESAEPGAGSWPILDYLDWEQWEPLLFGAYDTGIDV